MIEEIKLQELFEVLQLILSISENNKSFSWWADGDTLYVGDSKDEPSFMINKNRNYKSKQELPHNDNFLGQERYKPSLDSIYDGLGIPVVSRFYENKKEI
jgi:hypothetical protein